MAIDMRGKITGDKIELATIDGDKHLIAGSVKTAQMALSAVTAAIIADNAVTTSKVSEKVRTRPLASDDTEVSNLAATDKTLDYEVKNVRFVVKPEANATPDKIVVAVEMKTSIGTSAATLSIYVDSEATARTSVQTTLTTYDLLTLTFDVGSGPGMLATGVHQLKIKVKSAVGTATATIKLTEIYQIIL